MNILLDECVPAQVRNALTGHGVTTVQLQGWTGIRNGVLLTAAEAAGSIQPGEYRALDSP